MGGANICVFTWASATIFIGTKSYKIFPSLCGHQQVFVVFYRMYALDVVLSVFICVGNAYVFTQCLQALTFYKKTPEKHIPSNTISPNIHDHLAISWVSLCFIRFTETVFFIGSEPQKKTIQCVIFWHV